MEQDDSTALIAFLIHTALLPSHVFKSTAEMPQSQKRVQ